MQFIYDAIHVLQQACIAISNLYAVYLLYEDWKSKKKK